MLDTNAVLDWLVFRDPAAQPLAMALEQQQIEWLACAHMRDELVRVLSLQTLARYRPAAETVLARVDAHARWCPAPPPAPGLACADADDQIFVDLACAHAAHWLLTRDRALLALARRAAKRRPHALAIWTPARWADAHAPARTRPQTPGPPSPAVSSA